MDKCDSKQTLDMLICLLLDRLDDLNEPLDDNDDPKFILGSKTAYVECLEIIQTFWKDSSMSPIPANIERTYPVCEPLTRHSSDIPIITEEVAESNG